MKEGDLLLQAGLGGSLHLSPGKFKGRNIYRNTYATAPLAPTLSLY